MEQFLHEENAREHNGKPVTILLAGVRPDTLKVLNNIGFEAWFPPDQVFPEEAEEYSATLKAVRYAQARRSIAQPDAEPAEATSAPKLYYLV